jgi:hypothetical protein
MAPILSIQRTRSAVKDTLCPLDRVYFESNTAVEWRGTAYMEVDSSQNFDVKHMLLSFFLVLAAFTFVHHAFRVYVVCCRHGKPCCGSDGETSEEV